MSQKEGEKKARSAKDAALYTLSFSSKTVAEIRDYLKKKEYFPQEIEETVDWLIDSHLLSDQNYCETYVRLGLEKGRGPLRLSNELREKGVSAELISAEIEEIFGDGREKELAVAIGRKLLSGKETVSRKELERLGRQLAGRGFHTGIIWDVIEQFRKNTPSV